MVFRKIEDECLLVPIRNNYAELDGIFVLNEVGQRIWELLDGQRAVMDIRDIIVEEFEVEPQEALEDIVAFFGQLQEIGGVKVA
jgi:hypothetical protein